MLPSSGQLVVGVGAGSGLAMAVSQQQTYKLFNNAELLKRYLTVGFGCYVLSVKKTKQPKLYANFEAFAKEALHIFNAKPENEKNQYTYRIFETVLDTHHIIFYPEPKIGEDPNAFFKALFSKENNANKKIAQQQNLAFYRSLKCGDGLDAYTSLKGEGGKDFERLIADCMEEIAEDEQEVVAEPEDDVVMESSFSAAHAPAASSSGKVRPQLLGKSPNFASAPIQIPPSFASSASSSAMEIESNTNNPKAKAVPKELMALVGATASDARAAKKRATVNLKEVTAKVEEAKRLVTEEAKKLTDMRAQIEFLQQAKVKAELEKAKVEQAQKEAQAEFEAETQYQLGEVQDMNARINAQREFAAETAEKVRNAQAKQKDIIEKCEQKIADLQQEARQQEEKANGTKTMLVQLEIALKTAQEKLAAEEEKIAAVVEERENALAEEKRALEKAQREEENAKRAQEKLAQLTGQIEGEKRKIEEMKQAREREEAELVSAAKRTTDEKTRLNAVLSAEEEKFRQEKKKADEAKQERERLETEKQKVVDEKEKLDQRLKEEKVKLSEKLIREQQNAQLKLIQAEQRLANAKKLEDAAENKKWEAEKKVTQATVKLKEKIKEVEAIERQVKQKKEEVKKIDQMIKQKDEIVKQTEKEIKQKSLEAEAVRKKAKEEENKLKELQAKRTELERDIAEKRKQHAAQLAAEKPKAAEELARFKTKTKEEQEKAKDAKKEREKANKKAKQKNAEMEDAEEQIDKTKAELAALLKKKEDLEVQHRRVQDKTKKALKKAKAVKKAEQQKQKAERIAEFKQQAEQELSQKNKSNWADDAADWDDDVDADMDTAVPAKKNKVKDDKDEKDMDSESFQEDADAPLSKEQKTQANVEAEQSVGPGPSVSNSRKRKAIENEDAEADAKQSATVTQSKTQEETKESAKVVASPSSRPVLNSHKRKTDDEAEGHSAKRKKTKGSEDEEQSLPPPTKKARKKSLSDDHDGEQETAKKPSDKPVVEPKAKGKKKKHSDAKSKKGTSKKKDGDSADEEVNKKVKTKSKKDADPRLVAWHLKNHGRRCFFEAKQDEKAEPYEGFVLINRFPEVENALKAQGFRITDLTSKDKIDKVKNPNGLIFRLIYKKSSKSRKDSIERTLAGMQRRDSDIQKEVKGVVTTLLTSGNSDFASLLTVTADEDRILKEQIKEKSAKRVPANKFVAELQKKELSLQECLQKTKKQGFLIAKFLDQTLITKLLGQLNEGRSPKDKLDVMRIGKADRAEGAYRVPHPKDENAKRLFLIGLYMMLICDVEADGLEGDLPYDEKFVGQAREYWQPLLTDFQPDFLEDKQYRDFREQCIVNLAKQYQEISILEHTYYVPEWDALVLVGYDYTKLNLGENYHVLALSQSKGDLPDRGGTLSARLEFDIIIPWKRDEDKNTAQYIIDEDQKFVTGQTKFFKQICSRIDYDFARLKKDPRRRLSVLATKKGLAKDALNNLLEKKLFKSANRHPTSHRAKMIFDCAVPIKRFPGLILELKQGSQHLEREFENQSPGSELSLMRLGYAEFLDKRSDTYFVILCPGPKRKFYNLLNEEKESAQKNEMIKKTDVEWEVMLKRGDSSLAKVKSKKTPENITAINERFTKAWKTYPLAGFGSAASEESKRVGPAPKREKEGNGKEQKASVTPPAQKSASSGSASSSAAAKPKEKEEGKAPKIVGKGANTKQADQTKRQEPPKAPSASSNSQAVLQHPRGYISALAAAKFPSSDKDKTDRWTALAAQHSGSSGQSAISIPGGTRAERPNRAPEPPEPAAVPGATLPRPTV